MVFKNKEERREWYVKNRDKLLEKRREYKKKHLEREREYRRKYYKENEDKIKEYRLKYEKTPTAIKKKMISSWKYLGLKLFGYTYDEVYEYYLSISNCEICNKDISMGGRYKHLDHCHYSGCFRWVLCNSCNIRDSWMNNNMIN